MKYKTVKTTLGHKFRVRMDDDEILEQTIYRIVVACTPLVMITVFALAAGMLRW